MSELILEVSAAKSFQQLQQVRHKIIMGLRGRTREKDEKELQAAHMYVVKTKQNEWINFFVGEASSEFSCTASPKALCIPFCQNLS